MPSLRAFLPRPLRLLVFLAITLPVPWTIRAQDSSRPGDTSSPGSPPPVNSAEPNDASTASRLESLRAEIGRHDALYFGQAAPGISDASYDRLKRELRELERASGGEDGGTTGSSAALGDDRTGLFSTYRHRERMLGLEKVYTEAEVRRFHGKLAKRFPDAALPFIVEPKVDGLAVSVTYERGQLVRAVTRGNGTVGDDITANAQLIRNLPAHLKVSGTGPDLVAWPDSIELRGEIYLPLAEFRRLNREREAAGEEVFAHPRNVAAGTIRQLDTSLVQSRRLAVVFYGFAACVPDSAAPVSQRALRAQLQAWGLPALSQTWEANDAEKIREAIRAVGRSRDQFDFPIDGAVIKLDSVALQREVGASDTTPHWAVAYKFVPEQAETRVLGITLQVGRTGVLTPVAELEPVQLAGSRISRATLHNASEIARKDLRVGDFVQVEKAGEIIPAIVGVNFARRPSGTEPFAFPDTCPSCHTPTVNEPHEAFVRCPNRACPAQVRRRVEHFASKAGVDIPGLGPTQIATLVERGQVKEPADLYRLIPRDFVAPGKTPGKTANKLIAAIERSKHAETWRFLAGLGIPGIGPAAAKELASSFPRLSGLATATSAQFADLKPAVAQALTAYLALPENRAALDELRKAGVQP